MLYNYQELMKLEDGSEPVLFIPDDVTEYCYDVDDEDFESYQEEEENDESALQSVVIHQNDGAVEQSAVVEYEEESIAEDDEESIAEDESIAEPLEDPLADFDLFSEEFKMFFQPVPEEYLTFGLAPIFVELVTLYDVLLYIRSKRSGDLFRKCFFEMLHAREVALYLIERRLEESGRRKVSVEAIESAVAAYEPLSCSGK